MRQEKLLSMANQIASFFRSYPEEEAIAGIHHHIQAFWTPVMIETLRQHLLQDSAGADDLVTQAVCRGAGDESPVKDVLSNLPRASPIVSDAG